MRQTAPPSAAPLLHEQAPATPSPPLLRQASFHKPIAALPHGFSERTDVTSESSARSTPEGSPNLRAAAARQLMPPPGAVSPKRKAAGSDVDRPRSAASDASDGSVGSAGGNARRQRRQRGDGGIPLGTKGAGGGRKGGGRGGGRGGGSGRGR